MNVYEAIQNRRSIRAFQKKAVPEEHVKKLIDAARNAPSAGNIQPWEFVLVRQAGIKRELSKAALDQAFVAEAPLVIVVCADGERSGQRYGNRGVHLYCIQDTAAAIQNMLLTAVALGLGTCWVGAFHEEPVRKVLKTPPNLRPIAMIPIGYPRMDAKPRSKRPMKEIVHQETF